MSRWRRPREEPDIDTGYHHGNLRRALLDAAIAAIEETGPTGWSLRDLARRAGVSHAAPVHHFGDKAGLTTALAAEGYALFADALATVAGEFSEVGVAYVRFALSHRAHFAVMFQPELYRADDPDLAAARDRAKEVLTTGAGALSSDRALAIAAWSAAHGFAHLWLSGALTHDGDPEDLARAAFRFLFDGRT